MNVGFGGPSRRFSSWERTSKQKKHISLLETWSTALWPFWMACPFVKWPLWPLVKVDEWPLVNKCPFDLAWLLWLLHCSLFILCFFVPQQLDAILKISLFLYVVCFHCSVRCLCIRFYCCCLCMYLCESKNCSQMVCHWKQKRKVHVYCRMNIELVGGSRQMKENFKMKLWISVACTCYVFEIRCFITTFKRFFLPVKHYETKVI